jgi:hypothetical protein
LSYRARSGFFNYLRPGLDDVRHVKLPPTARRGGFSQLHLATSSDGKLLKLLGIEGSIKVQVASPCGTWGPLTYIKDDRFWWVFATRGHNPAVLRGGVIHWLSFSSKKILSYNLDTHKTGSVKLPPTWHHIQSKGLAMLQFLFVHQVVQQAQQ